MLQAVVKANEQQSVKHVRFSTTTQLSRMGFVMVEILLQQVFACANFIESKFVTVVFR